MSGIESIASIERSAVLVGSMVTAILDGLSMLTWMQAHIPIVQSRFAGRMVVVIFACVRFIGPPADRFDRPSALIRVGTHLSVGHVKKFPPPEFIPRSYHTASL